MAIQDQVKKASYRGVEVFYTGSTEEGGYKFAKHLYPDSNNFNIQQLGLLPKAPVMTFDVPFDRKEAWENALNTPGKGLLSHPMLGNLLVKVTTFNITDTIEKLGLYSYTVNFFVEFNLSIPTVSGIGLSVINRLRSNVVTNAGSLLKNTFGSNLTDPIVSSVTF